MVFRLTFARSIFTRLIVARLIVVHWIEDWLPRAAKICSLPDAAIIRRHVEDVRLPRDARNRDGASTAKWANHAPMKFLVHRRVVLLSSQRDGENKKAERGERNP